MGRIAYYNWVPADTDAIAANQSTGPGPLALNDVPTVIQNMVRTISITAGTTDLSTANFQINGYINGNLITEVLAGPGPSSTVQTTKYFDMVTSITVDAAVVDVSVGIGTEGATPWFTYNLLWPYACFTLEIFAAAGGTNPSVTFEYTLRDVTLVGYWDMFGGLTPSTGIVIPDAGSPTAFVEVFDTMTVPAGTSASAVLKQSFRYGRLVLTNASGQSFIAMVQQGVV